MRLSCIVDITKHFKCTHIAITSGQCSSYEAVEISWCSGVETTLEDCITTLSSCNNWGGIICSCKLLYAKLKQWLIIQ